MKQERATRLRIYLSCAAIALVVSYLLGKEMMWDTLDYHFYAGFSALHDRFGRDYFAAGAQSYFNPYVYAPFYALARSGIPALWIASLFAVIQSGILWLTYELALAVAPPGNPRYRVALGLCAVLLALANPILIGQFGSSYADITTAEIVLAGWLLLVYAMRAPSASRVLCAGVLLGAASALKLTNSVHALSACVLVLFLPIAWRGRARLSLGFVAALAVSFAVVAAPWAIRRDQYFGNPFFPLLNDIFRSPYFPAARMFDSRFVPSSMAEALWRPFAIALPVTYTDDELSSPDIRYALLLALALTALVLWGCRRFRRAPESSAPLLGTAPVRGLVALGCAFLVDWVLWLRASGNGRYFLAMASVAGALAVVLAFRIFAARRRVLGCLLAAVFAVQGIQLALGTGYRASVPWDWGSWFEVSVPPALQKSPALYFLVGIDSESFVAPFLGRDSAVVNLAGDYVLGAGGANGERIRSLIRKYATRIRVVTTASKYQHAPPNEPPELGHANDTLAPFGLRVDATDCSTITVRNIRDASNQAQLQPFAGRLYWVPMSPDGYLVACRAVPDPGSRVALASAEREPKLVFDRMEDACPQLFQPARPEMVVYPDLHGGYVWTRRYPSTNLTALLSDGSLRFIDGTRGGQPDMLGSESDWATAPVRLECGRRGEHYYARAISSNR